MSSLITRNSYVVQGFVCPGFHREECEAAVARYHGNNHGNHGNEWIYELKTPGEGGMHLQVYTPEKPDHVPADRWPDFRSGRDDEGFMLAGLVYHCPWALDREDVRTPQGVRADCDLAEPCRATVDRNHFMESTVALWKLFDRTRFEQPEAFWQAFKARFEYEIAEAKVERQECGDLAFVKCDKCDGDGVVPR